MAPDLIGCLLVKRQATGGILWGVIVETEAYSQAEPACHGYRRRSPSNETLFGEPGRFYVYVSHGIHHCVNVVTGSPGFANGVLLRAAWLPGEQERIAAGPALLAKRFGLNKTHNALAVDSGAGLWLAPRPEALSEAFAMSGSSALIQTTRIGISQGQELPWRWYWQASRSVSRRLRGDRSPSKALELLALALVG